MFTFGLAPFQKTGPSAGVAMFLALSSVMMNKPIASDHAMTGEISLRGLVLPVGGIKEKVLAALRAGIKTVMLPARNKRDLDDIPEEARNQLKSFFWKRLTTPFVPDSFMTLAKSTTKI